MHLYVVLFCAISTQIALANAEDFYSFTVQDNKGDDVSLEKYRGTVSLVVNVASLCGYTEASYRSLTKIHDILSFDGFFSVLAFPSNQFGDQEPEDAETVAENMAAEYGVEFPIFNKIDVIGPKASLAFRNLVEQSSKEPEWNFYKYLVDADGNVVNAWGTKEEIEDIFPEVELAIIEAKKQEKKKPEQKDDEPVKEEL